MHLLAFIATTSSEAQKNKTTTALFRANTPPERDLHMVVPKRLLENLARPQR